MANRVLRRASRSRVEAMRHDEETDVRSADLPPTANGPRTARLAVRNACAGIALPRQTVDDAALVAGELVTLSIRQTRSAVHFSLTVDTDHVTVRVADLAGSLSPAHESGPAGTRRSWHVVQRLSDSFGYYCDGRRREVWARLGVRAEGADDTSAAHGDHDNAHVP